MPSNSSETGPHNTFWLKMPNGNQRGIAPRDDHRLWNALGTDVGDQIEVWTFDHEDPNPIRLQIKDDEGIAEAWLSPDDARQLGAMLTSARQALLAGDLRPDREAR